MESIYKAEHHPINSKLRDLTGNLPSMLSNFLYHSKSSPSKLMKLKFSFIAEFLPVDNFSFILQF